MSDELEQIEQKINGARVLTDQDLITVHKMIKAYRGIMSLGAAGKFIVFFLATVAAGMTAWFTIVAKIKGL
jgi:hypothetical protein